MIYKLVEHLEIEASIVFVINRILINRYTTFKDLKSFYICVLKELVQTFSEENYLKQIFNLQEGGKERISTSSLAIELGINAASVTEKLKRLALKNLLVYEKSKGVALTEEGKKIAVRVIRKHRIWETFLVKQLNFGWEEVHEIAEQLEHIKSDVLVERIEAQLGFPRFDPHGDPIPDLAGNISKPCFKSISELKIGEKARITGVKSDASEFLILFKKLGFAIGTQIEIKEIESFDNSIQLIMNQKDKVTLSKEVATMIFASTKKSCCMLDIGTEACNKE